jgi:hypothetical protein
MWRWHSCYCINWLIPTYRALNLKNGEVVAVKRIKIDDEDILADIMVRFIGAKFIFFHNSAQLITSFSEKLNCWKQLLIQTLWDTTASYKRAGIWTSFSSEYLPSRQRRNIDVCPKSNFLQICWEWITLIHIESIWSFPRETCCVFLY